MTTISEFRCEICGTETTNPVHWFVVECGSEELKLMKWNTEAALAKGRGTTVARRMRRCTSAGGLKLPARLPKQTFYVTGLPEN
jgi:hypothetical protein